MKTVAAATMKNIELICTQPVSGSCLLVVGIREGVTWEVLLDTALDTDLFDELEPISSPPVLAGGMRVGLTDNVLYASKGGVAVGLPAMEEKPEADDIPEAAEDAPYAAGGVVGAATEDAELWKEALDAWLLLLLDTDDWLDEPEPEDCSELLDDAGTGVVFTARSLWYVMALAFVFLIWVTEVGPLSFRRKLKYIIAPINPKVIITRNSVPI